MHLLETLRRSIRVLAVPALILSSMAVAAVPAQAALIGYTTDANSGDLFRVDFGAGTLTRVGATGLGVDTALGDLATSNDGSTLYGISQFGGSIYTINPLTGAASLVNGNVSSNDFYQGFDLTPDGRAVVTNFDTSTNIGRINLSSPPGIASIQNNVPVGFVDAMAVESNTSIIVLTRGVSSDPSPGTEYLRRINLTTGAVSTIGNTGLVNNVISGVEGNVTGIDFFDGVLYGINLRGDLFRFNTTTGLATQIGSQLAGAGRGFLGLTTDVNTGAIPEPASVAMISIGLACIGFNRLRASRRARVDR